MKENLEPRQFDTRLLPTVIAIIILSLGALAWGWRSAHTALPKPRPTTAWPSGSPAEVHANAAPAHPSTASRNE